MFEVTACYLVLVGLYSTAISISVDSKLRQQIKRSLLDESKLLDSIGSAQMEEETMNKISRIVKEQRQTLTEQTGVQSSTDETDIKRYLQEVIAELEEHKK
jgi:hypothetical protein